MNLLDILAVLGWSLWIGSLIKALPAFFPRRRGWRRRDYRDACIKRWTAEIEADKERQGQAFEAKMRKGWWI